MGAASGQYEAYHVLTKPGCWKGVAHGQARCSESHFVTKAESASLSIVPGPSQSSNARSASAVLGALTSTAGT
jgi:hypothetical protein